MHKDLIEHPWLKNHPVLNEHKHLIIGTHPPMPYFGCMPYFYGNMNEFWRLLEITFEENLFFSANGNPDLVKIQTWLQEKRIAITDIVQFTYEGNKFNTDKDMIINQSYQYNQYLKEWLINSEIETIFFTSFSQGNSAYSLFKKWYKINFDKLLKNSKEIIDSGNEHIIEIKGKQIKLVMLYSPSPMARLGISNSHHYLKWKGDKKQSKGMIDEFRVNWYRLFFKRFTDI